MENILIRSIERGSHQELLAQNSRYAEMWALQQEEQEAEKHRKLG
jgi:flagellum-specific peptidoglycan hydrolase FlgJ